MEKNCCESILFMDYNNIWKEMFKLKNNLMIFLFILVFCLVEPKVSFSQNQFNENHRRRIICSLVFEGLSQEDRKELFTIRREDKEEFRKIMYDLMVEKKEDLEILKKEDPELYKDIVKGAQENIKKYLGRRKEKYKEFSDNKQKRAKSIRDKLRIQGFIFQTLTKDKQTEILELRRKYRKTLADAIKQREEQLKELKINNPEKFSEIISAAREKAKDLIKKGKEKYPQKFEKLGKMKSEYIEDRLKWLKEDDPELYNDVMGRRRVRDGRGDDFSYRSNSLEDKLGINEISNYYNEQ